MINRSVRYFYTLTYLLIVWLLSSFFKLSDLGSTSAMVYATLGCVVYAGFYLLVPIAVSTILASLYDRSSQTSSAWKWIVYGSIFTLAALPVVAVHADLSLYKLYAYHFDGFVWNLMTTNGGVDALGATVSTQISVAVSVLSLLLVMAAGFYASLQLARKFEKCFMGRRALIASAVAFLFLFLVEEGMRGYAKHVQRTDLQQAGSYVPFALKTSLSDLFCAFGIPETIVKTEYMPKGELNYPHAEIIYSAHSEPLPNIIHLTAESFRWDLLDPEVTPNLWKLAQRSTHFTNHYSGGNRTRMGMFSMYYGLYAPYWFLFEEKVVPPVLMQAVQDRGYQIQLNTSQSFDYPELRHTVFAGIPETSMHELQEGPSWQRDRENITAIQQQIAERDPTKPFYNFMFFESTHAPYNFPESAVIRPNYIKDVDYMKIESGRNISTLLDRYINAAHHIDIEVGRLLTSLEESGLMENTIILFTGDHGEEFMENGHWGHGHNGMFPAYQTRVPLIIYFPGEAPREVTTQTNHLQIPATFMKLLGVENDYHDYAMAPDLFAPAPDYFILGNYNYATLQDDDYKITFPFTGKDYFHYNVFYADTDKPLTHKDATEVLSLYESKLAEVTSDLHLFCKSKKGESSVSK